MKNIIFNDLYKELCEIKNMIDTQNDYSYTRLNDADGLEYLVILKNKVVFYVSVGTRKLPDFDRDDILYIRKKICENHFVDTEVGFFDTDDQVSHGFEMEDKYGAEVDFNTFCYD
jgi:hypothetical protein